MSKTANIVLFISIFLFLNTTLSLANGVVEFKYIFSDQFFSGENPLGKEIDPDLTKAKEAVITACKAWEAATGGSIKFIPANNPEEADIIFEGWSVKGPGVSIQDEKLCLDENDIGNLFSEYMPEALSFTIFDDCNSECRFPESRDPADADKDHRARIFFHKKTAPWFCVLDEEKVSFDEAQRDVIRGAMREIGHALGLCESPDENADECGLTPPCIRNSASIMCKNQVRCFQEGQDGPVPLGGMDDIAHPGVRDLTRFDKESVLKKFFPGTRILYGRVQDVDGKPIPEAVLSTEDGKFSARANPNGMYSLWHIVPGTYFIKVHHPENDQDVAEIITVSPAAQNMVIKDFKFTKNSQVMHGNTRVIPSAGGPDDIYTVVATFPGAFDRPPGSAKLLLDGQLVSEVSIPSTTGPLPQVFSYYGLTGLKPGEHYYAFKVAQREGDRQQTLNGSFKVSRPSDIRFAVESSPSIVSVGKDNHATVSARLKDKNGEPLAGETVRFQTSFPGFFTPSSGEIVTNAQGIAEIIFTPGSSGNATLTAIPPNGPPVTTSISCTSRPISIALEFHSAGKKSFKVISSLDYFTDKRPVAGEAVKWRLQPSEGCTWEKGPDQKTNPNGKAFGTFTIGTDESRRVSVTTTHIPTGTSGIGSFVFGGSERVQIQPAKDLGKATDFNGPKIQIAAPQSNASFSADSTEIKGKITGFHKISSAGVSVNGGEPGALALGSDGAFKKKISLKDGRSTILIQAEDLLKNTASFSMTIGRLADSTPPALTEPNVGSAIGVKGKQIHFSIRVLDGDSGIDTSKVTAGIRMLEGDTGATVQLYDDGKHGDKEPGDGLFANWWNSSEAGEGFHAVDFYAVDQAGNTGSLEGSAKIFVYDRPEIKKPYLSTTTPMSKESVNVNAVIKDTSGVQSADLLYSADAGRSWNRVDMSSAGATYIGTIPPQGAGTVYYKIKALDLQGFDSETGSYAYIVRDDTGPMISIQQPSTTSTAFTFEPFVLVSGRAGDTDGPGLKSVTCSSGAANTGTIEAWSFRVPLNKGINPITVVAESLNGKLAIDSIEVTYAPKLAAPSFSPDVPHIFTDPVSVEISISDKGAIIRYTTDNTDPTEVSPGVTSPILIAGTTTIKARAYMPGWTPSDTAVGTFTLRKKEKTDVVKAASPPKEKSTVKSESVSSSKEKSAEQPESVPKKETPSLEKKSEAMVSLALQVAAFRDKKFAEDLVKQLKSKGFSAYRVSGKSPGKATWHKVRIGPFKNKEEVETALEGLEKYKKKAIILVDQTGVLPENKEDPKHLAKKDLKTKPAVQTPPVSPKVSSARKKPKAAKSTDQQASEVETKKSTVEETASVIEIAAVPGKDTLPASAPETKKEKLPKAVVKETTPSTGAGKEKEPLAAKSEISDGVSQKERLKSFLRIYSQAYESKNLDKFVALFTYDATENNRPFYEMLSKYRKNMEMIESFKYKIEMTDYAVMEDTGNFTLQGKFLTQFLLHDGTRGEKSGNISMELEASDGSFLVKRLNYGE